LGSDSNSGQFPIRRTTQQSRNWTLTPFSGVGYSSTLIYSRYMVSRTYNMKTIKTQIGSKGFLVVVFLIIVACCPIQTTTAPEVKVSFFDVKERPIANLPVEQSWQDQGVETRVNLESKSTDKSGSVTFEKRVIWSSIILRFAYWLSDLRRNYLYSGGSASLDLGCDVIHIGEPLLVALPNIKIPDKAVLRYMDSSSIRQQFPGDNWKRSSACLKIEVQLREAEKSN
jgi:hypothetical protein